MPSARAHIDTYALHESMMSVAFDAPPGGKVTVTYPIEFAPDEPDDSDAPSR